MEKAFETVFAAPYIGVSAPEKFAAAKSNDAIVDTPLKKRIERFCVEAGDVVKDKDSVMALAAAADRACTHWHSRVLVSAVLYVADCMLRTDS